MDKRESEGYSQEFNDFIDNSSHPLALLLGRVLSGRVAEGASFEDLLKTSSNNYNLNLDGVPDSVVEELNSLMRNEYESRGEFIRRSLDKDSRVGYLQMLLAKFDDLHSPLALTYRTPTQAEFEAHKRATNTIEIQGQQGDHDVYRDLFRRYYGQTSNEIVPERGSYKEALKVYRKQCRTVMEHTFGEIITECVGMGFRFTYVDAEKGQQLRRPAPDAKFIGPEDRVNVSISDHFVPGQPYLSFSVNGEDVILYNYYDERNDSEFSSRFNSFTYFIGRHIEALRISLLMNPVNIGKVLELKTKLQYLESIDKILQSIESGRDGTLEATSQLHRKSLLLDPANAIYFQKGERVYDYEKKRALEDRVISTYNFEDFLGWEILRKAYVLDTSIAELLPCIFMSSSGQHIYIHAKNNDYEAEELGYSNKVSKLQPIKTFRNREAGARLSNLESFLDAVKSPSLVVVSNSGSGLNITELVGAADVEDADFSKVDINVFALPELEVVNLAPYAVEELDGKKIVNLYLPEGSNLISMIVYLDKERKEKLFHGLDYIIEQDKTHGWYRLVFLNNKAISEVYCSANCSAPKIAPRIDLSTFPVNNDMLNSLIEEYGIEVIKQLLEKVMNDKTDLTVQDIADVIYGSMQYGFSNDSHTPIPANPKLGFAPVVDQDTNKIIAQCDLAELMAMAYVQPNLPLEIRDQIYAANLITRSPYAPFNKDGLAYILMGIPHTSMRADVMVRGDRQVMDVDLTPALPADMLSIQNLKIDEIIGASAAEQNDNHNYKRNFIKERLASLYDVFSRYSIIDGSVDMSGFEKFENVTEFSVPTLEQIRSNLGKGAKGLPHTLYYSLLLYLKKEQENGKNILQILEDGQVINLLEKIIEDATMFADVARDPDRNRRKIIESIHIPSGIYNVILNEAKRLRGFLEKSIK